VILARQERQHAFPGHNAARAVQKQQRRAFSRFEDFDGRTAIA
jgi:hypothetical protein